MKTKILCLLRSSYMHFFDSLRLSKWWNIRLSEGYFVAKYKKYPRGTTFCVCFAIVSALFNSIHTHLRLWFKRYSKMHPVSCTNTYHDVTDLVNHGIVENTKTWISWEWDIISLLNKNILNLHLNFEKS